MWLVMVYKKCCVHLSEIILMLSIDKMPYRENIYGFRFESQKKKVKKRRQLTPRFSFFSIQISSRKWNSPSSTKLCSSQIIFMCSWFQFSCNGEYWTWFWLKTLAINILEIHSIWMSYQKHCRKNVILKTKLNILFPSQNSCIWM